MIKQEQLEDLLEQNSSDFEISKLFKNNINSYCDTMKEEFENNQGKHFLVTHTKKIDSYISMLYKIVLRRVFDIYLPMKGSVPITLIALGSYGREQLAPHSDIDLMIVYDPCIGFNTEAIIEKFLYLLWDTGLKIGHRVHTVDDIAQAANEDITIKTAMLEARYIVGSTFTWHKAQKELTALRLHEPKRFIMEKLEEAKLRREKHPLSMQPNIKECAGGLRDSHLLFWIAYTVTGVEQVKDLAGVYFSENAYKEYRASIELLYRVRSALHLITGKQHDSLQLEHLPAVSQMLGFSTHEKCASKVLEALWRINNFSTIFVKKLIRPYLYGEIPFSTLRKSRIASKLYRINGMYYTTFHHKQMPQLEEMLTILCDLPDDEITYDPSILSLFTFSQIHQSHSDLIYPLLYKLLHRNHLYPILKLFIEANILHEVFTPFKKVRNLPQFDGYHHYPVDLHSIECVRALEHIEDVTIGALYENMSAHNKFLVKLYVLLHDSGKGRVQDHSEVGVKIMNSMIDKFHLDEATKQSATIIMRHHILMSTVAFRQNIYNEKVLYKFMSSIQSVENLNILYVLTYADINGVGPGTWSSYGAELLQKLYTLSLEIAMQKERISDAKRRLQIEKRLQNSERFKSLPKLLRSKTLHIESNLFFFMYSIDEIIDLTMQANACKSFSYTLKNKEQLEITLFRRQEMDLGYLLAKLKHYNVVSMEGFTLYDDLKFFHLRFEASLPQEYEADIKNYIEASFELEHDVNITTPEIRKQEITLNCDHSKQYAELFIRTKNQQGLLAFIVHTLERNKINVATAKIYTTQKNARDSLLIEKERNLCDNPEQIVNLLTT